MFDVSSVLFFQTSHRAACVGVDAYTSVLSLHTHTHTHIRAVATGLLLPRRQINAFRSQCQYNVFVYLSSAWLLPSTQTDRHPQHHLCLFIIDQGEAVTPEGLRHGNFFFFPPPSHPAPQPLPLSFSSSPLVCSGSQCTSSNIVPTSWQSCAICTPCQGSSCHGYWQAPENKMSTLDSGGSVTLHLSIFLFIYLFFVFLASPPARPLLFSSKKKGNTCEVVVLCLCCVRVCVRAYTFFFSPPPYLMLTGLKNAGYTRLRGTAAAAAAVVAVVAAVRDVLFCQALFIICS